jgi:sec-independent protein translocase protein TatA
MLWSPPDIALILGVALVIFGPKRLPELGQSLGQGLGKFKKSLAEAETSIRAEVDLASSLPVSNPILEKPLCTPKTSGIDSGIAADLSYKRIVN